MIAVVLAGGRPGGDPMATTFGVAAKALIPVAGEAMLSRVCRTLLDCAAIESIIVLAQQPAIFAEDDSTGWISEHRRIALRTSAGSIGETIAALIDGPDAAYPMLITTADHPLLDTRTLAEFIAGTQASQADLTIGLVERRTLLATYPENKRTWLRFRGGAFSGTNLFLVMNDRIRPVLRIWAGVEQQRKRGRAIVGAFGPLILIGVLTRVFTLREALNRVGQRHGVKIAPIELSSAEACIDVDKPADHALATRVIEARR